MQKEEGTGEAQLLPLPRVWREVRNLIPEKTERMGAKGQDFKERLEVAKRNHVALP